MSVVTKEMARMCPVCSWLRFLFFSFKSLHLYECNHGCPQKQSLSLVVFTLEQSFEKEFSLDSVQSFLKLLTASIIMKRISSTFLIWIIRCT